MAKIVLQNQASPVTPDCGFTAMYVNCITGLPTFKRDDGTECSFLLACEGQCIEGMMAECVYDPNCIHSDVFAMDNMQQGSCKQYVTGEQITCWDNKANSCDVYNKTEVDCKISQVVGITLCPVQQLPETGELGVIYMVQKEGSCCDNSDEYVWRDDTCTFEFIGTTQVDMSDYAKCCDIPDISDLAQCCDIPDISNLAQCCDIPTVPTDNCQLANGCGYTKCTGDMQRKDYDPSKIVSDAFDMDNMKQGKKQRWVSDTIDDRLCCQSGINTGDETTASIKCKLGISTLSGCNTGDETNSTIKCKLGAANCADDGYLKACDFTNFSNKQSALVSGENIITINGCTILRCGDICVCNSGGDMKACVYDPYGCCTDMFNRANHYGCMSYACVTGLGSAATRDIGTTCGNVVVVQNDGKISSDVLPAQDVVDVCVFNSEAAMLAWCDANRGDMAIRTDIARTYVMSGSCPSCIDSWTILPVPSSPVTSVNGCIGDVCLTTDNIDDSNSTKKYVSASEKACWCGKADPYVSGCTIKTINGCSVLGCGDICIPNTITCVNGKTGNVCLTADDISDTGTGHLFVSQTEKNCWNCKINCEDAIVDNCQLCNSCGYIKTGDCASLGGLKVSNNSSCVCIKPDCINVYCGMCWTSQEPQAFIVLDYDECNLMCYSMCSIEGDCGCFLFDKRCDEGIAQMCDIPDTSNLAQCCDIPDISNFICACDIANKADCCDIPSIAGLVKECCVATINGCCLTQGGDICIQAGEGAEWVREDIPAGCGSYTLCTPPVNKSGFMVFVDSGLGMLPTNNYTYNIGTCTISFCCALACDETAKVWIMKQGQASGGGGGCAEWGYIGGELCDQADLMCALNNKADSCSLNGLAKECDIACINGCCLLCTNNICIKGGDYGWCDYIHTDQSCCICPEHQLIIEGTLTIDGELINDGKIFII